MLGFASVGHELRRQRKRVWCTSDNVLARHFLLRIWSRVRSGPTWMQRWHWHMPPRTQNHQADIARNQQGATGSNRGVTQNAVEIVLPLFTRSGAVEPLSALGDRLDEGR